eukprot:Skav200333  [mRNA]  locus=scaffold26:6693:9126:+ [translate_table: standard]
MFRQQHMVLRILFLWRQVARGPELLEQGLHTIGCKLSAGHPHQAWISTHLGLVRPHCLNPIAHQGDQARIKLQGFLHAAIAEG